MTTKEMETRLCALEKLVNELQTTMRSRESIAHREDEDPAKQRHWWRDDAGRFKDDPVFDEIVRLGREYRESLRPGSRTRRPRKKNVNKRNARP